MHKRKNQAKTTVNDTWGVLSSPCATEETQGKKNGRGRKRGKKGGKKGKKADKIVSLAFSIDP
jgi:hypothetical protein